MKRKFSLIELVDILGDEVKSVVPSHHLNAVITGLQQKIVDGMQVSKTAACVKTPKTEAELLRSDQKQHGFRYVGSSLSAGHPLTFLYRKSPKAQCLRDFQTLFGKWYDMSSFPVRGGRQVVAGVLANMLCFPVSLLDIEKWFFKPTSQKTVVHEELTAMLSSRGLTWPPNVQGFQHCSSYKRHLSSGKLASDDYARAALLPTPMVDLSTSEAEADDLAMGVQHFFSEEASTSGAQALSLGAQDEDFLIADTSHSSQWIGQAFQGPPHRTHYTKYDADQQLEANSSDITSVTSFAH
ncbi:TPA: hypothetical protein ACH3X2_012552 [Trebouxia sp. C0005]